MHEVDCMYHQAFFVCASAMGLCDGFMRRLANWRFGVKTSMQSPGVKTVIAGQGQSSSGSIKL
jgi:hypothetical protein